MSRRASLPARPRRPPDVRYHRLKASRRACSACSMEHSPAIRTATWDIVAGIAAAAAVLTDYSTLADTERNILRRIFLDLQVRAQPTGTARALRGLGLRADVARAGAAKNVEALSRSLPSARNCRAVARKRSVDPRRRPQDLHHPTPAGVDGILRLPSTPPDLSMVIYNPRPGGRADLVAGPPRCSAGR